jgi:hypothetical protein
MELLSFIENKTFDEIKSILTEVPFSIEVKEDGPLYLLKYNQIRSDFTIPIVRECRGVILEKGTNSLICAPFWKFFNQGESLAAKIEWSSAKLPLTEL